MWDHMATDLLLTAGAPPLARIDGSLHQLEYGRTMESESITHLLREALPAELFKKLEEEREIDFSFSWQDLARFRGSAFYQKDSMAVTLRLIPYAIPTFEDLGVPRVIEQLVNLPSGLILCTGPTGSGKSTSQAAMIDYINTHRACHILTVEDPIEYVHNHKLSAITQREVGDDTLSFRRALRSALREDPDVLLVGEMRDLESIQAALTIAETGHLVLATLHTNDTAQALDRVVDVFPADRHQQVRVQLAASLAGVIYQRLLPVIGGGMVAAFEIMIANNAVRNLVREGKNRQLRNVVATHVQEGMQTLEQSLTMLVKEGVVEYETALGASLYPKEVERPAPVLVPVGGVQPVPPAAGPAPDPSTDDTGEVPVVVATGSGGRFRSRY
jgi:twitching motility protein PilT